MTGRLLRTLLLGLLIGGTAAACSVTTTTTPTTPTIPTTLTGTWAGDLVLQGVATRMTWTLTQNGAAVTGPVLVLLPTGTVLLNGQLTGTVSGSTLSYAINIGNGAIPAQPTCAGQLGGSTAISFGTTSTLAGNYVINSSTCTTPFSSGTFTLTKQ
jgi:hypothetical protein